MEPRQLVSRPSAVLHPPPSLFNSSQTPGSVANWGLEYCALGINAALSEMSTVALRCVRLWGSCNGYWSTVRLMQSCPATTRASCTTDICMRWAKTEKIEKKEPTVSSPSFHGSLSGCRLIFLFLLFLTGLCHYLTLSLGAPLTALACLCHSIETATLFPCSVPCIY